MAAYGGMNGQNEGQGLPSPSNPFDATFSLLRGMQQEIQELKVALEAEKNDRIKDVAQLSSQLDDLRQAKNSRFENLIAHVEEISNAKLARFDKLEAYVEELRASKTSRLDKLEGVVAAEVEERRGACTDIVKKVHQEASQWRSRCEVIEKTVTANKKQAELAFRKAKDRHDELLGEVEKHNECLTNNSMAMDPFKHFVVNPFIPNSATSHLSTTAGSSASPWTTSSNFFDASSPETVSPRNVRLPKVEGASQVDTGSARGFS